MLKTPPQFTTSNFNIIFRYKYFILLNILTFKKFNIYLQKRKVIHSVKKGGRKWVNIF